MNAIHRFLRGPQFARLLTRFGIDPKRYWLLMDLFAALTERREVMNQLGRDGVTLQVLTLIYGGFSALLSLALVLGQPHLGTYLLAFFAMTLFVLLSVLLPEISNSLINPVEGLILAHQPINGATYTAAKLTHLLRILLYLIPAVNIVPALAGLALTESRWYYPLQHMLAAFLVGLLLALIGCGVFGWLIRFVPVRRLRAAGQIAEFLPMLAFFSFGPIATFLSRLHLRFPAWLAGNWQIQAGIGVAVCGMAVLGIRSLSGDYLVRVSSIMQGKPQGKPAAKKVPGRIRRSFAGDAVALLFGGQASRAGFEYTRRMMVRDWQFRRGLISLLPLCVIMLSSLPRSLKTSPFSGQFSPIHFAPHIFGFVLFSICPALTYGRDYKGVWIFLLAPGRAFGPLARGVYSSLWLLAVVLPHLALLALLSWRWGWMEACLFTGYSGAMASLYLGLELRLIDGVPFSKQLQRAQGAYLLPLMFAGGLVAGIFVALQYFLLFPSRTRVAAAAIVFGCAAYFATRSSLQSLEIAMRYNLGIVSSEATLLYTEVD